MGTTVGDEQDGAAEPAGPSYLEVARRLMGSARDLVGADAADDLVFDTMSALLPRWDAIIGDRVAYARRAMVNRFRDQYRHLRVESTHRHSFLTPDRVEPANDRVAARLDLDSALEQLPERTRQVVVLRYQLDLPAADVAGILGIPAGSVRRIAHEGLRILSDALTTTSGGTTP